MKTITFALSNLCRCIGYCFSALVHVTHQGNQGVLHITQSLQQLRRFAASLSADTAGEVARSNCTSQIYGLPQRCRGGFRDANANDRSRHQCQHSKRDDRKPQGIQRGRGSFRQRLLETDEPIHSLEIGVLFGTHHTLLEDMQVDNLWQPVFRHYMELLIRPVGEKAVSPLITSGQR